MSKLRKLQMHRANGNVIEIEIDEEWTCFKAAYHIAHQFGMPIFEYPWCIGLAEEETPHGKVLYWANSDALVRDLPEISEARLFLSHMPIGMTRWN